ncbi:MAG TPA: hypothetical protein EYP10_08945, partial [Armatimonadetes bacterium]|nr:hypothetical protein [Armatimonadota bacterium]
FKWNVFNVCYTTVGRDQWKNPPAEYRQLLRELCEFSHARGLEVMAFINPYYLWREHIHISRDEDIDALVRTCSISLSAGSRKVMLCLDDFASPKLPYQLIHEDDRQRFGDLASANIYLINTLYKRLRARYPNVELFVVLPYYWLPRDYYREAGEKYLKRVGTALHPAITIVWTGPVVRSLVITEEDIHRYTQLIGRKPFLWDNTLYARHTPPSYLFDEFVTQYPRNMHELTAKGVHYNAGGSEIYKVGLITAADRLWNPEAYDPERSLRQALAIIGGPRCVDELLAFRNAYYELYDSWMHVFESLAQLKKHLPSIKTSPLDEQDINSLERLLDGLQRAFDAVQRRCDNAQLVEELRQRCKRFTSSRKVIAESRKRMSASQGQVQRIIIHATMEGNERDVLRNIGCYRGAGGARIEISHDAYEGTQSAKLTATEWYPLHGRDWINVGLMIGNTDGYSGINALQVPAFTKCSFSLWIKGNVTKATISAVGWKGKCGRVDRHALPIRVRRPDGTWTQLNTKQEIQLTNKWHKVEGYFTTLLDTRRVALRIGIVGYRDRGAQLGTIWVDDVRIWYYQLDE